MMNQYAYMQQAYPNYYAQSPSNEYLEQRRISMPVAPYGTGLEQQYFTDNMGNQCNRSNSMADAMSFNQFQQNTHGKIARPAPPGLAKNKSDLYPNSNFAQYKYSDHTNSESEGTQESYANDPNRMNKDFAKMSLSGMNKTRHNSITTKLMAATGELSCHSNSTIKEEEFDSERDANERSSDGSNKRVGQYQNDSYYDQMQKQSKQYYNNLLNDDELRNQKRRESYQIPVNTLDGKKMIKSPLKSGSQAFVPNKKKDVRTGSMPNIFYPISSGVKTVPNKPPQNNNMGYYQFGSQPNHPMMNYTPGMVHGHSPQMAQNNDHYETQSTASMGPTGSLAPPNMMDYDYEQRRNSGTTGGSSNIKDKNLLEGPRYPQNKHKKNISGPHNKARRSSNTSNSSLVIPSMDYKGQIAGFAKNQQGSKYLQRVLAKASPDILDFVVVEVGDKMHELMTDSYGNYFCQKLLQSSSSKQRLYLLQKVSPYMVKISCDKRGTHSMQSLIQLINMKEEEEELEKAIVNNVVILSFDSNGTHVLQKVLLTVKPERLDYIFNACYDKLIDLSLDANGLCVIKKIVSRFNDIPDKRAMLVQKLSENCVQLVQSPYGNYAIQQGIEHWTNEELKPVYENLHDNILQLSMQKFSSNVIEK
jgi:hypothetical protein